MFLEYREGNSLAHRLDARTKLFAFTATVVLTFLFTHPLPNAVLAGAALALLFALGTHARQIGKLFAPLVPVLVLIVLFAAVSRSTTGRVLVHFWFDGGLPVTTDGLADGVNLGLRILAMVCLTSALVICTPIEHFVAVMRQLRMPYPVVFIVMTALRFVPTMQHRANQVLDAQRARGARIADAGMFGAIRAYTTIMVPLFATGIRMSEELAAAMQNRGYGITRQPTQTVTLRATWRDALVAGLVAALLVLAFLARIIGSRQ